MNVNWILRVIRVNKRYLVNVYLHLHAPANRAWAISRTRIFYRLPAFICTRKASLRRRIIFIQFLWNAKNEYYQGNIIANEWLPKSGFSVEFVGKLVNVFFFFSGTRTIFWLLNSPYSGLHQRRIYHTFR